MRSRSEGIRGFHGRHDDVIVALGERGEQIVKAHVLDLQLHAHLVGNVLRGGNVDTGKLHLAAVIGIHELERGIVGRGAEHQRAAGLLGVVGVGVIGGAAVVGLAAAGNQRKAHHQSQHQCGKLFHG